METAVLVLGLSFLMVAFLYFSTVLTRILRRTSEFHDLAAAMIAQINNLDKKVKRAVEVLEDMRAGRGPESDCERMFGEAEEQKAALFQLIKRSESLQATHIASGLKKEVLRLYQEVIRRFPESREATIARERCEEIERVVHPGGDLSAG